MKKFWAFLKYFFSEPRQYSLPNIVIIFFLIILFRTSVVNLQRVASASMEDTLLVGDTMLVFRTWYGFRPPFFDHTITPGFKPQYGDIVIFEYPFKSTEADYVKRLVAMGGDAVMIEKKQLFVNDYPIPLPPKAKHADPEIFSSESARDYRTREIVPHDSLFVLGDNRDFSYDSRSWKYLPRKNLRGKVGYVLWSLDPKVSWSDFRHKWREDRFFLRVE